MTTGSATDNETLTTTEILEKEWVEVDPTLEKRWKVIAHNDDVTTMEFVVRVLVQIFKKPLIFAEAIMWQVHHEGEAVVDVLPKADAEQRTKAAMLLARLEGFPFQMSIEPAED